MSVRLLDGKDNRWPIELYKMRALYIYENRVLSINLYEYNKKKKQQNSK